MMILAAVILLIGFIALAGMVSRVSQLGSQTTIENDQAILEEIGPLNDSMNSAICRLKESTISKAQVTDGVTTADSAVVTSATAAFVQADVGMVVSGAGLLPGSRIQSVESGSSITLTNAATTAGTGVTLRFVSCLAPGTTTTFNRGTTTSPTMEASVISVLEQLQSLEASRGLLMDWSLGCRDGVTTGQGQATVHLWDGTVWIEVKSSVMFARAACTTVTG